MRHWVKATKTHQRSSNIPVTVLYPIGAFYSANMYIYESANCIHITLRNMTNDCVI
jgi:hypothetical protein